MYRLSDSINEYLAARKARGKAANTIKNDQQALDRLLLVAGNIPTAKIDGNHVDQWLAYQAATCGPGTLNARQSSLAAFIKWATARGHLPRDADPLSGIDYRKVPPRDRLRVPLAKFNLLLDAAEAHHPRDRMMVALGLFLMLRQSEACDLRIGDVNLDDGLLSVRIQKTSQADVMPIPTELDRELRPWLALYAESAGRLQPEWYLLPSRVSHANVRDENGRYLRTERAAGLRPLRRCTRPHEVVKRALRDAGFAVEKQEGMHTLRRSGARALFDELSQAGYDGALRTVQTMLHHSTTNMTERYIGISLDKQARDKKFAGKTMFPSLVADNVVPFPQAAEG
jgi:integrase